MKKKIENWSFSIPDAERERGEQDFLE